MRSTGLEWTTPSSFIPKTGWTRFDIRANVRCRIAQWRDEGFSINPEEFGIGVQPDRDDSRRRCKDERDDC